MRVKQVGNALTHEVITTLYFDAIGGTQAANAQTIVEVCFGDGTTAIASRTSMENVSATIVSIFKITHTYTSAGQYVVSARIENRTGDMLNLPTAVNTSLYLQTVFNMLIANTTPILRESAGNIKTPVNQPFRYNVSAFDEEADSLAYRLSLCYAGNACNRLNINGYAFPNDISAKGTFKIDAHTGLLEWNAPTQLGKYAFALVVEEWRKGVKISETLRDMYVSVIDAPNSGGNVIPPYQVVNIVTGVNDVAIAEVSILCYPMPTQNQLQITIQSQQATRADLYLIDIQGHLLKEINLDELKTSHTYTLDTHTITSGTYLLNVKTEQGLSTRKVVKW